METTTRRDFIHLTAALTGAFVTGAAAQPEATSVQAAVSPGSSQPISKPSKLRTLLQRPGISLVPEA